jgi:hypothetical protein
MTVRTLAEAAAEVLNKTRASAPADTMHKLNTSGQPGSTVHDLGGSTLENPEGNSDIGARAAAAAPSATPPGKTPASGSKEGMKKLAKQPQETEGTPETSPEKLNGPGVSTAGHGYMQPTKEEAEVSEEEVIYEEEDSSETSEESLENEVVELSEAELEEIREAKKSMMREKMKHMGMKEDMDALFNNEDLSEDFRTKASTIFESAVITRAITVVEEMEKEILESAEETIEEIKAELEEQVDSYLNYVVEQWVKDNEVAIESGLKSEVVEDFMVGLKNLFAEHYIDVPSEKVDVLEAMVDEVEELKSKLNEALNTNIELSKAIVESRKSEMISSVCEGLTATQAEKVKTLAEGVEFTTEGEYTKKLEIIRENYFTAEPSKVKDVSKQIQLSETNEAIVPEELSPLMERYVNAIRRTNPV